MAFRVSAPYYNILGSVIITLQKLRDHVMVYERVKKPNDGKDLSDLNIRGQQWLAAAACQC